MPRFVPRFRPGVNGAAAVEMPSIQERRRRQESALDAAVASARPGQATQTLVLRLSDPSFEIRQAATQALMGPTVDDPEIWAVLDRATLDDEAHDRLLQVAVRRVLDRPRGALGVRMGNSPPQRPGVQVQATLPGLPADNVLKVGDVIEKVDGVAVRETPDLVEALQSKSPGTEVTLVVLRAERDAQGRPLAGPAGQPVERRMEFRLPLGNANDLDRFEPPGQRLPGGLGNVNSPLEQRREQAALLQRRFARKLPEPLVVPADVEPAR